MHTMYAGIPNMCQIFMFAITYVFDKRDRQQKLLTIFGCENNLIFDELLAENCIG